MNVAKAVKERLNCLLTGVVSYSTAHMRLVKEKGVRLFRIVAKAPS